MQFVFGEVVLFAQTGKRLRARSFPCEGWRELLAMLDHGASGAAASSLRPRGHYTDSAPLPGGRGAVFRCSNPPGGAARAESWVSVRASFLFALPFDGVLDRLLADTSDSPH